MELSKAVTDVSGMAFGSLRPSWTTEGTSATRTGEDASAARVSDTPRDASRDIRHPVCEPLAGPPEWWVETIAGFEADGFDTIVFWPVDPSPAQVELLINGVVPLLRS